MHEATTNSKLATEHELACRQSGCEFRGLETAVHGGRAVRVRFPIRDFQHPWARKDLSSSRHERLKNVPVVGQADGIDPPIPASFRRFDDTDQTQGVFLGARRQHDKDLKSSQDMISLFRGFH
jgi:hypothetical protein